MNITAVNPAADGYLQIAPAGTAQPNTSTLSYKAGRTLSGFTTAKLSPDIFPELQHTDAAG